MSSDPNTLENQQFIPQSSILPSRSVTLFVGRPSLPFLMLERDAFRLGHILHFGNSWHIHRV